MPVTFHFKKEITLRDRKKLKAFISKIFINEGKRAGNISFVFCSDKFLLGINQRYLSHDYYTDIITFDLSNDTKAVDAEIFISTDRIKENAIGFGQPILSELHRVIFHGILHLCGYLDKTADQKSLMRKKENALIKSYFQ